MVKFKRRIPLINGRANVVEINKNLKDIEKIKWFHTINLGNGIITKGLDKSQKKLEMIKIPRDLKGKTVLDIGAWDGFFSFAAEKRGAKTVLATDDFCWNGEGWGTKDGFNLVRKITQSKVKDKEVGVMDLSPKKVGTFDLVLFLGVLYHMRHPLLALEKVASVTKDQLILETFVNITFSKKPLIEFYPNAELDGDSTNWSGPNEEAVVAMLKTVGFKKIEIVYKTPFLERFLSAVYGAITYKKRRSWENPNRRMRKPFFETLAHCRMIVHAWK